MATQSQPQTYSYTYEDEKAFRQLSWSWSRAYDTKDWTLLHTICAPTINAIYSSLAPHLEDKTLPRDAYIAHFSHRTQLGDERLKTQHLLGEVLFTTTDSNHAAGDYQVLARHIRKLVSGEVVEWTASSYVQHYYERIEGVWKLAGIRPHDLTAEVGKLGDVVGREFE